MLTSTGMRARRSRTTFGVAIATENVRQNTSLQSAVCSLLSAVCGLRSSPTGKAYCRYEDGGMAELELEEARHAPLPSPPARRYPSGGNLPGIALIGSRSLCRHCFYPVNRFR